VPGLICSFSESHVPVFAEFAAQTGRYDTCDGMPQTVGPLVVPSASGEVKTSSARRVLGVASGLDRERGLERNSAVDFQSNS
jgi:hypothetical protein